MTDELKPCPFGRCRAEARIEGCRFKEHTFYYVVADHTPECPLYYNRESLNDSSDRDLVIQRWNARWEDL